MIKMIDDITVSLDPDVDEAYRRLYIKRLQDRLWRCYCTVSGVRRLGVIYKQNNKTVWVKIMKGAKDYFIIKRHIKKHKVEVNRGHNKVHDA